MHWKIPIPDIRELRIFENALFYVKNKWEAHLFTYAQRLASAGTTIIHVYAEFHIIVCM